MSSAGDVTWERSTGEAPSEGCGGAAIVCTYTAKEHTTLRLSKDKVVKTLLKRLLHFYVGNRTRRHVFGRLIPTFAFSFSDF